LEASMQSRSPCSLCSLWFKAFLPL